MTKLSRNEKLGDPVVGWTDQKDILGSFVLKGEGEDKVGSGEVVGTVVSVDFEIGGRVSGGFTGADIGAFDGSAVVGKRLSELTGTATGTSTGAAIGAVTGIAADGNMLGELTGTTAGTPTGADIGAFDGTAADGKRLGKLTGTATVTDADGDMLGKLTDTATGIDVEGESDSFVTVVGAMLLITVVEGVFVTRTVGVLVKYEKSISP